jgi:hypothetical protein
MIIARNSWYFYGTLYISNSSFEDIRQRLVAEDLDWKYILQDENGQEIIVLGTTALKAETNESCNSRKS